jgi:hypothetical protein
VAVAVVFALAAAFSIAVNLMTQHSASVGAPSGRRAGAWPSTLSGSRHVCLGVPLRWARTPARALALHNGPMSVVQPVLVSELVFVLVLRRARIRQDVARPHGPP